MIRIDEIYNNTFWPWIKEHHPGVRMFFYEPFGRSDPDSVFNYGLDRPDEHNYILFHDQEPIHLDYHGLTFKEVWNRNNDLHGKDGLNQKKIGCIVTSEKHSKSVKSLCGVYGWKSYYYFFHGWAALDWYRGYDKTFLIRPYSQRTPTRTFIAPNRIIAGKRQHRLEMLYWIFRLGMNDNHISCPLICPAEGVSIYDAVKCLDQLYPDAADVFAKAPLPMQYSGETDHPMHSCWLSLFDESADSLLYLVTETVATGQRLHLTEKTFKAIAQGMPFVIVSTAGSLEYLRSYGFRTFGHLWDESYDTIQDDHQRIEAIGQLLKDLDRLSAKEKLALHQAAAETVEHNWRHFYNGGFEEVLWTELKDMLRELEF